ncbi:MAG TPA: hypothetical protein P5313_09095 [Spirochaetia bacterium]|nr:hypothetical protein [Spirochaetales bacterium]HRY80560.1 hypothetical protein [Spirochaetia bacterium]
MKRCLAAALAAFVLAGAGFAQTPPKVLSPYDIERFIKDIPGLMADLEAAGSDFDEEVAQSQDDPASFSPASLKSLLAKARTSAEVRRTLEKYNWDGRFWDVYYTIYVGVYVSMMDQALVQYPSPELKALVDPFRTSIHKDDHALVLRNLPRLLEVFEALDAED